MKRLLCVVGKMDAGGAETFLMKIYRNIDRNKFQMDFCVSDSEVGVYETEILSLGGKIFHTIPKTKSPIKSFFSLKKIVEVNNYKYVMRISQHSLSALELLAAKLGGAEKLIFRSSNTNTCGGRINQILHRLALPLTIFVPNIKMAPSSEAAKFMFGRSMKSAFIFPNALDTEKFLFRKINRDNLRKKMNLENKLVIGHIGRFSNQKNHKFVIECFKEIKKIRKDAVLLLIGDGELRNNIETLIKNYSLSEDILLLGIRKDIPELLSIMDGFLFPSFYEGMPNTVIEAQTSGLPCLISDTITREAKIIDTLIEFKNLEKGSFKWAESMLDLIEKNKIFERKTAIEIMKKKGYEISEVAKTFEKIIFE